jgi:hypothetical protein
VTLVIETAEGVRVRNLISETFCPAGENVIGWDAMDDLGRDVEAAKHGIYSTPGKFVLPGAYRVRGLSRQGLDLRYEFPIYTGGSPAWLTADNTGGWLTNHTPPMSALYVPADRSYTKAPLLYLGSFVAEGGHGLAWVTPEGKKVGGKGWIGGIWTGAPYLARDVGPTPERKTTVYVGAAWEKELRLTALTGYDEKNIVKYSFPSKEQGAMGGLAVYNGLLACSLTKLGSILFVDTQAGVVLGTAPLAEPRGVAFDAQGRLLALSGTRLLRFTVQTAPAVALSAPETLVATGLDDPQQVTLDAAGTLYISDRGTSHQVKLFSPAGQFVRALGRPGLPAAGPTIPCI